jgi:hypothetical protein
VLLLFCQTLQGTNDSLPLKIVRPVDSLNYMIDKMIESAPKYSQLIEEYTADVYTKGYIHIKKSNLLINYLPSMFKRQKGVSEYLTESFSELHYTAPGIFDRKIKASNGTIDKLKGFNAEVLDLFDINIYSNSIFNFKLLSPLSRKARKYYLYHIDSVYYENGRQLYRLSFIPKYKSYQLIDGQVVIRDSTWEIHTLQFKGRSEYLNFTSNIQMGEPLSPKESHLPVRFESNMSFRMLGNVMESNFIIYADYNSVKLAETDTIRRDRKSKLDLTRSFTLRNDTSTVVTDSVSFAKHRPVPLSEKEKDIYQQHYAKHKNQTDTVRIERKRSESRIFWSNVGDFLIESHSFNSPQIGRIRISPMINPLSLSYSGNDGLSYKHKTRYQRFFNHNRMLNLSPMIGYNFKYKEFYWRVPVIFEYFPKKTGLFALEAGNGNRIYNSEILDKLKEIPDSIFDFNKIHLDYFRDFYLDFYHRIEVVNGLTIDAGGSAHRREAVKKSDFGYLKEPPMEIRSEGFDQIALRDIYISFAPRIKIFWTPRLYYYKVKNRKINLYSRWPTFSFDYERGIKGIFKSTAQFERLEFDMQHTIPVGLLRTFYYRAGGGIFTNKEETFFIDFRNFAKNNLPSGWNDDIGGTFQNLDRRWYNASKEYLRVNVTYEAPFLMTSYLFKRLPNVLNERIYVGVLAMNKLNPYIEIGYGFGTHFFDAGAFVSNKNGKFYDFGLKVTLELFNR